MREHACGRRTGAPASWFSRRSWRRRGPLHAKFATIKEWITTETEAKSKMNGPTWLERWNDSLRRQQQVYSGDVRLSIISLIKQKKVTRKDDKKLFNSQFHNFSISATQVCREAVREELTSEWWPPSPCRWSPSCRAAWRARSESAWPNISCPSPHRCGIRRFWATFSAARSSPRRTRWSVWTNRCRGGRSPWNPKCKTRQSLK